MQKKNKYFFKITKIGKLDRLVCNNTIFCADNYNKYSCKQEIWSWCLDMKYLKAIEDDLGDWLGKVADSLSNLTLS